MRSIPLRLTGFSPVAGIQWVETSKSLNQKSDRSERFSPVAGIQWVETVDGKQYGSSLYDVSVPLPGFSGLRRLDIGYPDGSSNSFSPVAGIQWVETSLADSISLVFLSFQSRCRDSVG